MIVSFLRPFERERDMERSLFTSWGTAVDGAGDVLSDGVNVSSCGNSNSEQSNGEVRELHLD
jgi:hypothetical protein